MMNTDRSKVNRTDVIAVPFAHLQNAHPASRLNHGDYIQLYYYDESKGEWVTKFPANTTIGFGIHSNSYVIADKRLNKWWQWINFSLNTLNEKGDHYSSMCNAGTLNDPFICFGFEDVANINSWGDKDYNDVMFHMLVNPSSAIGEVPEPLPDPEDDDKEVGAERYGILAFEDLWPSKGDYDLNDVVVRYDSKATLTFNGEDQQTYLTKLEDTFSLLHSGASFNNKFGIKIDADPNLVESITINGEAYTKVPDTYNGNKTATGFILDICDDIHSVIKPYLVNEPYDYNIVITFKKGITEAEFEKIGAPYNPFITTPKGGTEVHLPCFYPTSRVNMDYFGTNDDCSNPDSDIYYVSGKSNRYPFALHLSGVTNFVIPEEGHYIDETYPKFNAWVESGCKDHTDWYLK